MRPRHLAPLALLAAPVIAATACYGPTQVTIELATDIDCSGKPTTIVLSGPPYARDPLVSTETCTPAPSADAEIGSVAFVPNGDRSGRAAVKVVMAVGQRPEACDAHPEACIVATRSFAYVEHRALLLPVRLRAECLGKVCPDDQTCSTGGACVPNAVDCVASECALRAERPPPGPADAGAEDARSAPNVSSPPLPSTASCAGPSGDGLVATSAEEPLLSAFGDGIVYFTTSKDLRERPGIGKVSLADGLVTTVTDTPVLPSQGGIWPIDLATAGSKWVLLWKAYNAKNVMVDYVQTEDAAPIDLGIDDGASARSVTFHADGGDTNVYVARDSGVTVVDTFGQTTPLLLEPAKSFEPSSDFGYVEHDQKGLLAYDFNTGAYVPMYPLYRAFPAAKPLAYHGGQVFAFGRDGSKAPPIFSVGRMVGATYRAIATTPGQIRSIAADTTYVYVAWDDVGGTTISRATWTTATPGPSEVLLPGSDGVARERLGMSGGCLYFWSKIPSQKAELRVISPVPP
jgi:hypothetical protein